jgi:predicted DNA-binding transcriptional regulator AlpA
MTVLLTEKQVAQRISLSVHWLRRKRWAGGGIPFVKLSDGGAVRYRENDVEAFLTSRVKRSTSDAAVA